jgi:hypothetical protein
MTIDEIFDAWNVDSKIDKTQLGNEAINIPKLHHKYYRIYMNEKLKLLKMQADLKQFTAHRHDFYSGAMDDETLRDFGWLEEFQSVGRKTILKSDISRHLESDNHIIEKNLKVAVQLEKIELLNSIIKSFVNRGFLIKNGIEWEKFMVGA